jgi:hypothetical protein
MQVDVDVTVDDPDVSAQLAERETYGPLDALHPDDYVSSSKKHQKTLDLQEDIALSVTERAQVRRRQQEAIDPFAQGADNGIPQPPKPTIEPLDDDDDDRDEFDQLDEDLGVNNHDPDEDILDDPDYDVDNLGSGKLVMLLIG